jgi:hypothetical protein
MKHGEVQNAESEFAFWILPGKPMEVSTVSCLVWDQWKTHEQTNAIKRYLGDTLEAGSWMETNHRFFFKNREDYDNMLLILKLGWNG